MLQNTLRNYYYYYYFSRHTNSINRISLRESAVQPSDLHVTSEPIPLFCNPLLCLLLLYCLLPFSLSSVEGLSKQFIMGGTVSDVIYKSERDKALVDVRKGGEWTKALEAATDTAK